VAGTGVGTRFVLGALATWRVAHLLAEEDGPADLVVRLRTRLGSRPLGELMDCFYCLSVWVAAPASLTVARRRRDLPLAWLALSGAACLLERATAAPKPHPEDTRGELDELLWEEEKGARAEPADAREPDRRSAPVGVGGPPAEGARR
jgi:hypothetical protein